MEIIKDLLRGANPIIILLLVFLIWQVVNHIPTQIKELRTEVKTDIKKLRTEVKTDIKEVKTDIKELRTEINNRLRTEMNNRFDKLYQILLKEKEENPKEKNKQK